MEGYLLEVFFSNGVMLEIEGWCFYQDSDGVIIPSRILIGARGGWGFTKTNI